MKIGIIGCGVIGEAFAQLLSQDHTLFLLDKTFKKAELLANKTGARAFENMSDLMQSSDVVLLCFKPKDLQTFSEQANDLSSASHLFISMLAGVTVAQLTQALPQTKVIRAMPNLPVICGHGVIGFAEDHSLNLEEKEIVNRLFHKAGFLVWISEKQMDGLATLTGSSPAFILLIIEAMVEGGVLLGFSPQQARELICQTIEGTALLLKTSGKSASELKLQITSPGGTTIEGLKTLEKGAIRGLIMDAFEATTAKSKKLI